MDLVRRAQIEDEEERRWQETGEELRQRIHLHQWQQATVPERMELLTEAHDLMRPAFDLTRSTRLVFVTEIDGLTSGGGYDDEVGTYVLLVAAELERDDPGPLIAGIAHELRHAYQHEARDGINSDERSEEWREAQKHYDNTQPGYEYGPLEVDAHRAQVAVGAGYAETEPIVEPDV